jgi:hypothetical protein
MLHGVAWPAGRRAPAGKGPVPIPAWPTRRAVKGRSPSASPRVSAAPSHPALLAPPSAAGAQRGRARRQGADRQVRPICMILPESTTILNRGKDGFYTRGRWMLVKVRVAMPVPNATPSTLSLRSLEIFELFRAGWRIRNPPVRTIIRESWAPFLYLFVPCRLCFRGGFFPLASLRRCQLLRLPGSDSITVSLQAANRARTDLYFIEVVLDDGIGIGVNVLSILDGDDAR